MGNMMKILRHSYVIFFWICMFLVDFWVITSERSITSKVMYLILTLIALISVISAFKDEDIKEDDL